MDRLNKALACSGLRLTRQRRKVYEVLLGKRDHPTVDEVFTRVKKVMPTISLATVYNCVETLVDCGVIRQVNRNREPTRYCPNLRDHGHFYCRECGSVHDIHLPSDHLSGLGLFIPANFQVSHFDITLRGTCPACAPKTGNS